LGGNRIEMNKFNLAQNTHSVKRRCCEAGKKQDSTAMLSCLIIIGVGHYFERELV
jgi:hypothetical protein